MQARLFVHLCNCTCGTSDISVPHKPDVMTYSKVWYAFVLYHVKHASAGEMLGE